MDLGRTTSAERFVTEVTAKMVRIAKEKLFTSLFLQDVVIMDTSTA